MQYYILTYIVKVLTIFNEIVSFFFLQDYDSYYERRGFDDTRDLYERRFTGMTGKY